MIARIPDKQPNEKWYIPFNFTDPLVSDANPDATEVIGEVEEVTVIELETGDDKASEMSGVALCRKSGRYVYVWIEGGDDGKWYKISCRASTEISKQEFELEALMLVREV